MQVRIEIAPQKAEFPAGTKGGNWQITVFNSNGVTMNTYIGPEPSTVMELPAGTNYTARGWREDSIGGQLGPSSSVRFDVVDTTPVEIYVAGDMIAEQIS